MNDIVRGIGELGEAHTRTTLKAQFDELLDAAAVARDQNCNDQKNNSAVVYLAAQLMGKVLCELAQIPLETEEEAPWATMYALMQWLPAFSRREDLKLWTGLIDELLLLPIGSRPSLLVPKILHSGEQDKKLAIMKVKALKWDAYLKGRSSLSASGYQSEISQAFGASSWDTIRHWNTREVAPVIEEYLEEARRGVGEGLCYPDYEENLWSDGDRYLSQADLGVISFEEFMKRIGKS